MKKTTINHKLTENQTGVADAKVTQYLQMFGFVESTMEPTEEEYCEAELTSKYGPCMYLEYNSTATEKVIIRINDVEGYVEKINVCENYHLTNHIKNVEKLNLADLDDKLNSLTSNYR